MTYYRGDNDLETGSKSRHWAKLFIFPLIIVLSLFIALFSAITPFSKPIVQEAFSVDPAMEVVRHISVKPRPAGSEGNSEAREFLVAEFRNAGLEVEVQSADVVRQPEGSPAVLVAPVNNVIARLRGSDSTEPAIALMAHYDTVPYAYGAGDNGSGVGVVIQTARMLAQGPRPKRDVIFILTDGEELGLLGAEAFFSRHDLGKRIGAVVNVEARGTGGRAVMFETSGQNGELVSLWARHDPSPSGNSLTDAIYKALPNDTDLTVALEHDKIGINAAFIGNQFDYHNPTDRMEYLDRGSLQDLGDFAYSMTRALAFADSLPDKKSDAVFFDVLGIWVVQYPQWVGWILFAVATFGLIMALRARSRFGVEFKQVFRSAGWLLMAMVAVGLVLQFLPGFLYGEGAIAGREQIAELPAAFWVYLAICLAAVLLLSRQPAAWLAAIVITWLLALCFQILVPGGAFLFVFPLLFSLLLFGLSSKFGTSSRLVMIATLIGGLVVLSVFFGVVYFIFDAAGALTPLPMVIVLPVVLLVAAPALQAWVEGAAARRSGLILLFCAFGGALLLLASSGFSERKPRPDDLFILTDADSDRTFWATRSGLSVLPAPGEVLNVEALEPFANSVSFWGAPRSKAGVERPSIEFLRDEAANAITIRTEDTPQWFAIALRPSGTVRDMKVAGVPVSLAPDGWTYVRFGAVQPVNLTLEAASAKEGAIEIRYIHAVAEDGGQMPASQSSTTAWTPMSGSRAVAGTLNFTWKANGPPE